jgi:hypothetical protein
MGQGQNTNAQMEQLMASMLQRLGEIESNTKRTADETADHRRQAS